MRLVTLTWVDAEASGADWQERDDLDAWRPPRVMTTGWVYHEPTDAEPWWVLIGDRCESTGQVGRGMLVPGPLVRNVREWGDDREERRA